MNIRNFKLTVILGLAVLFFASCEGTEGKQPTGTTTVEKKTESADSAISNLELDLDDCTNQLGKAKEEIAGLTEQLWFKSQTIKAMQELDLSDPIVIDTCLGANTKDSLIIAQKARRQLQAKNNLIEALEAQIAAHKSTIQKERLATKVLVANLSNISNNSPYHAEKAKLVKEENGYVIQFEQVTPLMSEVEEIIEETFAPLTSKYPFYNFSVFGGVAFTANDFESSTYQSYILGAMYRPKFFKNRIGFGASAMYAEPSVKYFSPDTRKIGGSILLEYNFKTN